MLPTEKYSRYVGGIHQCVCTHIRENFQGNDYYYPVQYNWVDNMVFIGREMIRIEYINQEREVSGCDNLPSPSS